MRTRTSQAFLSLAILGLVVSHAPAQTQREQSIVSTEGVAEKWKSFRPRFVASDCRFLKPGEAAISGVVCGTIEVPEDRANPASGLISIAIMKVVAVSQPAPSGTLVWLDSGPGSASISARRARDAISGRIAGLRRDSDLLFFDQRGTGYSQRDFCRDIRDAYTYGVPVEPDGERRFWSEMRQCLDKARAEGIPVDAYSHWQIALDVRDIRIALGLESWNVFGYLTSAEMAQAVIQVDPNGVRSAILDSPTPTDRTLPVEAASLRMDKALRGLTEICRQSPRCAELNGDFHQRVLALLDAYERNPLVIEGLNPEAADDGRLVFDDRIAANFLMFIIYDSAAHADLPAVLSALERRDARAMHTYAQARFQPRKGRASQATRYAIKCRNNCGGLGVSAAHLAKAQAAAPGIYRRLGLFRYTDDCEALGYGPPDPSIGPTRSDRPILIADGRLDPAQSYQVSQTLAAGFPRGQLVLFPYGGIMPLLSQLEGCGGEIIRAFLANPMAPIDDRCVQAAGPPVFLTDYRETSAPGRMMFGISMGDYPIGLAVLLFALLIPFFSLPVLWTARRLRKGERSERSVPLVELLAWVAILAALGGVAQFAHTMIAWSKEHWTALPAGVPSSVLVSTAIAGSAVVIALLALGLALRGSRFRRIPGSVAAWATLSTTATLVWLFRMI